MTASGRGHGSGNARGQRPGDRPKRRGHGQRGASRGRHRSINSSATSATWTARTARCRSSDHPMPGRRSRCGHGFLCRRGRRLVEAAAGGPQRRRHPLGRPVTGDGGHDQPPAGRAAAAQGEAEPARAREQSGVGQAAEEPVAARTSRQGDGVAPELLPRLFTRFAGGPRSDGLGLGLYLAHQIAAAHGGTLSLDSRPGRGARFALALPADSPGGAGSD
jgi:hypothetical protein